MSLKRRLMVVMAAVWALSWVLLGIAGLLPGSVVAAIGVLAFMGVFAFGETLAHLHCLETRARVKRAVVDGVYRFVAVVDPNAEPPADDSDTDVMDVGTA